MPRIKQFGVGVDEHTMARLERLRACLGESRSQVVDQALVNGGLDALEGQHAAAVKRFNRLAKDAGQDWEEYAFWYGRVFARQTYPPTVADLETQADAAKLVGKVGKVG